MFSCPEKKKSRRQKDIARKLACCELCAGQLCCAQERLEITLLCYGLETGPAGTIIDFSRMLSSGSVSRVSVLIWFSKTSNRQLGDRPFDHKR